MDSSQSNVNANISLAQFSFNVLLMDSYSTDYYDIAYPGLIMKVEFIRYYNFLTDKVSATFNSTDRLSYCTDLHPISSVCGRSSETFFELA